VCTVYTLHIYWMEDLVSIHIICMAYRQYVCVCVCVYVCMCVVCVCLCVYKNFNRENGGKLNLCH